MPEEFSAQERALLERHFTNTDGQVFALHNLDEVVKGALFARYSRSPKSIRRLFLDEFMPEDAAAEAGGHAGDDVGAERAKVLYKRVFAQYGDDSVAQLGAAHLACEQVSNVLTKVLERGRLASYLEQSTRYIYYDEKLNGRYRYVVPPEVAESGLRAGYEEVMDGLFDAYSEVVRAAAEHLRKRHGGGKQTAALEASIRAEACDAARGLLPGATASNVGIFASGQALERLLMRLAAHPLREANECGAAMLLEARKVVPDFLTRVDLEDRGAAWSRYMRQSREDTRRMLGWVPEQGSASAEAEEVALSEHDPEGERRVAAAVLYETLNTSYEDAWAVARNLSDERLAELLASYCGERGNRRHLPGRAMEDTYYRFDILSDYGSFRDLQRHRMLTIEWQTLSVVHGYAVPELVGVLGMEARWRDALGRAADLHGDLASGLDEHVAQYAVPFAHRIRYTLKLNAREAFHLLELRTSKQGHADYRRICAEMYRHIERVHPLLAQAMRFVDTSTGEGALGRLEQEERQQSGGRQLSMLGG